MAMTTMLMTKTEKDCNRTGRRKNFERIIPLSDNYIGEGMSNIMEKACMILVEIFIERN